MVSVFISRISESEKTADLGHIKIILVLMVILGKKTEKKDRYTSFKNTPISATRVEKKWRALRTKCGGC